jgi:long-chain acyl-CoA synthetase
VTWDEAIAAVCGPGGRYEITEGTVFGRPTKVFARTPLSLRHLFGGARAHGEATFLVYEDERRSFTDVMDEVDAFGAALVQRYRVQHGDRVAIAMRNYPEWLIAFAAITSVGAVAVCLNGWWTADELHYGLSDSGSRVLVADDERVERSLGAARELGVQVIAVRSARTDVDRWEDVVVPGTPLPEVEIAPDDDATILYTSGTTGNPKGAVSTHRAVLSALLAFGARSAVNALVSPPKEENPWPTSFILVVPLFHVTGLVPVMLSCFAGGYKLVIMYRWDPGLALEHIEAEHITNFVGVPTQSWDLLEHPDFATFDTSSLAAVGGGGAPAPPELVHRIDGNFSRGRPTLGYGMTETNAYGPGNSGDDYVRKPRSTGRTVPIMDVVVRDPQGHDLAPGEIGEIWFRGPNLIRGYWNKPEATAETIVDGWLRTGDLGRIDDEGFVFVEDRAKDMVLRGGENVYCAEVEAVIYEFPSVYEAAVFGVTHERLGEAVAVAVYARDGETIDVEALQAHVRAKLAGFKVPTVVEIVGEPLPRNASGKILKRQLRDEVEARRA